MGNALVSYAIQLTDSELMLRQSLDFPLLVWATPGGPITRPPDHVFQTLGGGKLTRPRVGEPVVFELRKQAEKVNPFAMGITVGRNDNNDVVLDDSSISRFHAYFQKDVRSGKWRLVDAESRNGTWVGPLKLAANSGQDLLPVQPLRFGDLSLSFMMPDAFVDYLKREMDGMG